MKKKLRHSEYITIENYNQTLKEMKNNKSAGHGCKQIEPIK